MFSTRVAQIIQVQVLASQRNKLKNVQHTHVEVRDRTPLKLTAVKTVSSPPLNKFFTFALKSGGGRLGYRPPKN